MIKGIYLREKPKMDTYTSEEILSEFDPANKIKDDSKFVSTNYTMITKDFESEKFNYSLISIDSQEQIKYLKEIYGTLMEAAPEFLKALVYGKESVLIVTPHYEDMIQDMTYCTLMEELVRITAYILKEDNINVDTTEFIRGYLDLCVSYPGNRDHKIKES